MLQFFLNDNPNPIEVYTLSVMRTLESPVSCQVTLPGPLPTEIFKGLISNIGQNPQSYMSIFCNDQPLLKKYYIKDVFFHKSGDIEFKGIKNVILPKEPLIPRRRIHVLKSFGEILSEFQKFLHVPSYISTLLDIPLEKNSFLFQYYLNDWQFLLWLLLTHELHFPDKPVSWAGRVEDEKFVLVGNLANLIEGESEHKFTKEEGFSPFSLYSVHPSSEPVACSPGFIFRRKGSFQWEEWQEDFLSKNIPLVWEYQGSNYFIEKREDRVYTQTGVSYNVPTWETYFYARPQNFYAHKSLKQNMDWPGSFQGKVAEISEKELLVTVELEGFEPNYNLLPCSPLTAYSGESEQLGLHFIPEKDTRVEVELSPVLRENEFPWMCKAILSGNVRIKKPFFPSPFLYLEKVLSCFYNESIHLYSDLYIESDKKIDVHCKKEGSFQSDTSTEISQKNLKVKLKDNKIQFIQ